MLQKQKSIEVVGAGIVGLVVAYVFAQAGYKVRVFEARERQNKQSCSWWAGGMLAPWCESESAEPIVTQMGLDSIEFWKNFTPSPQMLGTLVVAPARDLPDLKRFAQRTKAWEQVDAERLADLESELSGRFMRGLFYAQEGHLDPRQTLNALEEHIVRMGCSIEYGQRVFDHDSHQDVVRLDCTGLAAQNKLLNLRGVKGEMMILYAPDVTLRRPVRLLHPRIPLYVVPRDNHHYMVGATMIESEEGGRASARSILELLSAVHVLHPGFAEAQIIEIGVDVRPSFPDNIPAIVEKDQIYYVNGMYRHGFLAAPALAMELLKRVEKMA